MSQSIALIHSLKRSLKRRGLTYRDVAAHLHMSEASVKRLFASHHVSLQRLEAICELAGSSLLELAKQTETELHTLEQLTEAQEQELAAEPALMLVAFLTINGLSYDDILAQYNFQPHELVGYLAKLDRIRLIELLPNNRYHLLISPNFNWRSNGPIQQFFRSKLQQDFLNSRFQAEDETLLFLTGILNGRSTSVLQKRLEDLAREFNDLNRKDMGRDMEHRNLTSMILALRPWRPGAFEQYRKQGVFNKRGKQ